MVVAGRRQPVTNGGSRVSNSGEENALQSPTGVDSFNVDENLKVEDGVEHEPQTQQWCFNWGVGVQRSYRSRR